MSELHKMPCVWSWPHGEHPGSYLQKEDYKRVFLFCFLIEKANIPEFSTCLLMQWSIKSLRSTDKINYVGWIILGHFSCLSGRRALLVLFLVPSSLKTCFCAILLSSWPLLLVLIGNLSAKLDMPRLLISNILLRFSI